MIPNTLHGGPLAEYRSKATFDWNRLKMYIYEKTTFPRIEMMDQVRKRLKNINAKPIADTVKTKLKEIRFKSLTEYLIPRKANTTSDVTPNGKQTTTEPEPRKRFAAITDDLNYSRLECIVTSMTCLQKGIVIAVRYAAVRKQFGPTANSEETTLLEYPLHQSRLMPYLSACFVFDIVFEAFGLNKLEYDRESYSDKNTELKDSTLASLNLIVICLKVITTWRARDGLQQTRECCGGHAAGIGDLRNENDCMLTLEGDNHVLLMEISKCLMTAYRNKMEGKHVQMQFGVYDFLENLDQILQNKCDDTNQLASPRGILNAYNWLVCYLLTETVSKLNQEIATGCSEIDAFNKIHTYYGKNLAIAFSEFLIIRCYFNSLTTNEPPKDCAPVLQDLGMIYASWSLEKHLLYLCKGNYFAYSSGIDAIRTNVTTICLRIKNESVALVDVIAPPDEILNSVLGSSDGQVYKRLVADFLTGEKNLERPHWWKEMRPISSVSSTL